MIPERITNTENKYKNLELIVKLDFVLYITEKILTHKISIYLSIYLFIYLSISMYLSIYPSNCLSVYLPV